ncbi:MAG TPA: hypothetical protein VML55_16985, partial [Planctomycetaceae bacterium]|nr:hypothetical protein [Planctomycetaceae bacterium]
MPAQTTSIRDDVQRLLRQQPFRPFVLNLENGDRLAVGHPETIAFDPAAGESQPGWGEFYVISGPMKFFGTFDAVTSVALQDPRQ